MDVQNRFQAIHGYFQNKDTDLAVRRLIDVVLDTEHIPLFVKCIAFVDWRYSPAYHPDEAYNKALDLLKETEAFPLPLKPAGQDRVIEAQGLHKKYAKGNFQLGPVDFSLKKGEILGLVGENGNGKTTLIRLLYGDLEPDAGRVNYYFHAPGAGRYNLRTAIAYVPQRTETWYGSLMDNLQFTAAHYGYKPEENEWYVKMYMARLGLWPYRDFAWKRLSGGYKMRFELARTLLRKPKVLLLDEPLANLDIVSQQLILEDLKFLAGSETHPLSIILSSQQLYEVEKVSTDVLFLNKGRPFFQRSAQVAEEARLIIELETTAAREVLEKALAQNLPEKVQFNGGAYVLHFAQDVSFSQVLKQLGESGMPLSYIRNISDSSRRFFVQ